MPGATYSYTTDIYQCATDIPAHVWRALEKYAVRANCILPIMVKVLEAEREGMTVPSDQSWIVYHSPNSSTVDFILSSTRNEIGDYPIFIVPLCEPAALTVNFIRPRLEAMVDKLLTVTKITRVYSVFAPYLVSHLFSKIWTELTGIQAESQPYYDSKLSYCTESMLQTRENTMTPNVVHKSRAASNADIPRIAELCYEFARDSEPFILSGDEALFEAKVLVGNQQVWVHEVSAPGSRPNIACIAAFTRNSETNATITKVFTDNRYRGLKCAQRLVRRVCQYLFTSKDTVSLYVGRSKGAAAKVYHNVGFVGLEGPAAQIDDMTWLEIGFDRTKVTLGHW
ncbi:hypothetical protein WG66_016109 [Moniliophthora roreri]|uniref:N-acetyltransferase domain-containing protein n=1 Tax=Moniliophthora roreri TaxID=221103 RepID=A0A0W0FBJ1_MONRR|nr:hypothetical protein WG66_016109 [Moniliophthora roreri]